MLPRTRKTAVKLAPLRWAVYGAILGLGAPAGLWVLLRILNPPVGEELGIVYMYTGVATSAVLALFGTAAGSLMARLRDAGLRDALTGLHNRRFLMEILPSVLANAARRKEGLCVLMLDLDHFKRVNDTYGHAVGDTTLQSVATALAEVVRRSDTIVRFGGEEFLVVCPAAGEDVGKEVAERLRKAIESLTEEELGFPGPQTISIGLAASSDPGRDDSDAILAGADDALYAAKEAGRNRIEVRRLSSGPG